MILTRKPKYIWYVALSLVLMCCAYVSGLVNTREFVLKRKGNDVIQLIERFREKNGVLPSSLADLGIVETDEGPIYYKKQNNLQYIVWFGAELGESVSYSSQDGKWSGS